MALEKVERTNGKGKKSIHVVLARLNDEAKAYLSSKKCLAYVNQRDGVVYAVEMKANRLSDQERRERQERKEAKSRAFKARCKATLEAKIAKAQAKLANLE